MAEIVYRNRDAVWVKVRVPRPMFEALAVAYGSQHRALRAFRENIPGQCARLAREAPAAPSADGPGRSPGPPAAAVPAGAAVPEFE